MDGERDAAQGENAHPCGGTPLAVLVCTPPRGRRYVYCTVLAFLMTGPIVVIIAVFP